MDFSDRVLALYYLFLLVCLTSVFTGECFLISEAGGRRNHGKMDSQKDPWTEWCGGEAACGVLLQPKDDPGNWVSSNREREKFEGSQLGFLEGVAYS